MLESISSMHIQTSPWQFMYSTKEWSIALNINTTQFHHYTQDHRTYYSHLSPYSLSLSLSLSHAVTHTLMQTACSTQHIPPQWYPTIHTWWILIYTPLTKANILKVYTMWPRRSYQDMYPITQHYKNKSNSACGIPGYDLCELSQSWCHTWRCTHHSQEFFWHWKTMHKARNSVSYICVHRIGGFHKFVQG